MLSRYAEIKSAANRMDCSTLTRKNFFVISRAVSKEKITQNKTSNPSKKAVAFLPATQRRNKSTRVRWMFAAREVQGDDEGSRKTGRGRAVVYA